VVDVVERIINLRDDRLADGISLQAQYKSLRDPARNALRSLQEEVSTRPLRSRTGSAATTVSSRSCSLSTSPSLSRRKTA
jgi:hypothetical protein